jgi:hypothetical protein
MKRIDIEEHFLAQTIQRLKATRKRAWTFRHSAWRASVLGAGQSGLD